MIRRGVKLQSRGQYKVWLRKSRKYLTRAIWSKDDDSECFIKWCGKFHEVRRGAWCYYTVADI